MGDGANILPLHLFPGLQKEQADQVFDMRLEASDEVHQKYCECSMAPDLSSVAVKMSRDSIGNGDISRWCSILRSSDNVNRQQAMSVSVSIASAKVRQASLGLTAGVFNWLVLHCS